MSKGSGRRPCQLTREEEEQQWIDAFGPRPIPNVMSDVDRESLKDYLTELHNREDSNDRDREAGGDVPSDGHESRNLHAEGTNPEMQGPFWIGPGYHDEYTCPHGVGHGNHIHGCDGCCSREDFPGRSAMKITKVPNNMKIRRDQ